MSSAKPTTSVLMAVRNGEAYVHEALTSVLAQTLPPDEVIVVDDGSTDGTNDVLGTFRRTITVVSQPPSGIARALNVAVGQARGELVAFIDADDLWPPDSLAVRRQRLLTDDALDGVSGQMVQFLSPELVATEAGRFRFDPNPVPMSSYTTLLFRSDRMRRFGPFDESVPITVGPDWIARARREGMETAAVDEVVLRRRIHLTNISHSDAPARSMLDLARRHHQRRRPKP